MYRKVITYTDFNGVEKTKTFYFNLTRPELIEMKRSPIVEMQHIIERVRNMKDPQNELTLEEKDEIQGKMGDILRELVIQSYGVKSEDGETFSKRFNGSKFGAGESFVESMAYDALYMEMISDIKNLINFVRAVIPASVNQELESNPEFKAGLKELNAMGVNTDEITEVK